MPLEVAIVVALAALAMIGGHHMWDSPPTAEIAASSPTATEPVGQVPPAGELLSVEQPIEAQESTSEIEAAPTQPETTNRSTIPAESTPLTRALVAQLTQFQATDGMFTTEQTEQWKLLFHQLIQQGGSAVPAIREFLEQNRDITLASDALGYSSLRSAFFDALEQIGGQQAQGVMLEVLQTTAMPSEIARLARYLEQQAPGQFRDQITAAARDTLAQAAAGQLRGWDVGPLFQTLQSYGGASAATELERDAAKWNYYATLTLANMPAGEGIPALIGLAQNASGSGPRGAALEALAQVAVQHPNATDAMVELARSGGISDRYWISAASALGGDRSYIRETGFDGTVPVGSNARSYHLEASNQNFYTIPALGGMSNEQISQRVAIIDQLLAVSSSAAVVQALQNARSSLLNAGQQGQQASLN